MAEWIFTWKDRVAEFCPFPAESVIMADPPCTLGGMIVRARFGARPVIRRLACGNKLGFDDATATCNREDMPSALLTVNGSSEAGPLA